MKTTFKFEGGDKLAATLRELPTRVAKNILRDTLKTVAAPPIQQQAMSLVARAPGAPDLADHIVVSTSRTESGPTAAVVVGPSSGTRSDQPGTRFDQQGRYLEFGTARMKMHPFLRPAFDQQAARTIPEIASALWHALIRRGFAGTRGSSTGGGLT